MRMSLFPPNWRETFLRRPTRHHTVVRMIVDRLDDVREFIAETEQLLLEDEARHNLIIGLAHSINSTPALYPEHRLWLVRHGREVVAAALRTPPHNLVVARPRDDEALMALAAQMDDELPGVTGAIPEVDVFTHAWCERRHVTARVVFEQGIFELRQVADVPRASGTLRDATHDDLALLAEWVDDFSREALGERRSAEEYRRQVLARLDASLGGFGLWEDDGAIVSLCGFGGLTPHGIRIGPVYTPPALRGHGYATSLTATVSARLLRGGRKFCFLYTNLANPTSNAIYQRMGYVRVCDSRQMAFADAKV